MDIRWRNYSHSIITKMVVFILVIVCFTGAITVLINTIGTQRIHLGIAFEDNYYLGDEYTSKSQDIAGNLIRLIRDYKSKEYVLNGGTVTKEEIERDEENLYMQFRQDARYYDPQLTNEQNYAKFREVYSDKISQIKDNLIKQDFAAYNQSLQRTKTYEGILFFASDGEHTITNSSITTKDYFKSFPSYMIFDEAESTVYPKEIKDNKHLQWIKSDIDQMDRSKSVVYIAFSEEVLKSNIDEWMQKKAIAANNVYTVLWFLLGLVITFAYMVLIVGRKSFQDKAVYLNSLDKLYNDVNIILCLILISIWVVSLETVRSQHSYGVTIPITASIATAGFILVLSLVKHIKSRTIVKHSIIFKVLYGIFKFFKDTYANGSVGVKVVLIVIVYPVLAAATFFMFPITLGLAAWLALKQVKKFNAIKEGVEKVRNGEIHYSIDVTEDGELGKLAANINCIAEGLNKAVDSQLKSERLKTELITNVSHDIRTPLTSIITYVDLLKNEKEPLRSSEYIEVIEQKAERLKVLTDDLFEAAKASSGNIPVSFERIDIVSLVTQGLGELHDKIEASALEFKVNHPSDKIFIEADGKLFWRALENLLSNIFKYALKGSRVYINIEDLGNEVMISIKNISAYELNISAEELMERFKRGDESRSSQGSGLGLSIAKSLIDIQKGRFHIEVDGDLFKAIIKMPADKVS